MPLKDSIFMDNFVDYLKWFNCRGGTNGPVLCINSATGAGVILNRSMFLSVNKFTKCLRERLILAEIGEVDSQIYTRHLKKHGYVQLH